jgi:MFS family permease
MSAAQVVLVVAAATAAQTITAMGTSTLPVVAPKLAESLGIDPAWIGMQVSIAYAAAASAALIAGGMVRRIGACRAMQIALLCTAFGTALAANSSVAAIGCGSLLIGAAMGLGNPPAAQLMLRFAPPSKLNLIFSIKQTGVPLGFTLSALIAPSIALAFGWQWSLVLVTLAALGIASALQVKRSAWDGDRSTDAPLLESPFAGLHAVWRIAQLRYLVLTGSAFSAIQVCTGTFAVTMLVSEIGYGLVYAGVLTSLMTLCGVSARLVGGWFADRFAHARMLLAGMGCGMIVCCLSLVALDALWPPAAVVLLFIALGVSVVGWNGILHAEVARLSPPGTVSLTASGLSFFIFAAVAITPALAAVIYQALGRYSFMFGVLSLFALLGLLSLAACARLKPATH